MGEDRPQSSDVGEANHGEGEGTAAMMYALVTSFSEFLGAFEERLGRLESTVKVGQEDLARAVDSRAQALMDHLERDAVRPEPPSARVEEALDRLVVVVEGRQAGLDLLLDTVRSLASRVELLGARIEQAQGTAGAGADDVVRLGDLVRRQSELVDERTAALSDEVRALRALLQTHVDEAAQPFSRRASEAGRRLADDLRLRGRQRQPPGAG